MLFLLLFASAVNVKKENKSEENNENRIIILKRQPLSNGENNRYRYVKSCSISFILIASK